MRTIRQSVFETNSSSTHCVTFVTPKEYEDFVKRRTVYNAKDRKMVPIADLYPFFTERVKEQTKDLVLDEQEVAKRMPSCETFCKWVEDWHNIPTLNTEIDEMLYNSMLYTLERDYCTAGYSCDWTTATTTVNGTEIMALSFYKGE